MYRTPYVPMDMVVVITAVVDEHEPAVTISPWNSGPTELPTSSLPPAAISYIFPHIKSLTVTLTVYVSTGSVPESENIHKLCIIQVYKSTNAYTYMCNMYVRTYTCTKNNFPCT